MGRKKKDKNLKLTVEQVAMLYPGSTKSPLPDTGTHRRCIVQEAKDTVNRA